MKIAGFKKQSLIDYPGNISSVIFTQGCNFRCSYCHNPDLVLPEKFGTTFNEEEIFDYIAKYKNLLDAVCITGGEPTIHNSLLKFITRVKELNLKVKLDTNGTNSNILKQLLNNSLVDFIAMDIKHILEFNIYNKTVGGCINNNTFSDILMSIELIKNSKIDHEFRTTVAKGLHNKKSISTLKKEFKTKYKIHNFNPEIVLNKRLNIEPFSEYEFDKINNMLGN